MQNCNIHSNNPEDFTFWIFWLDSSPLVKISYRQICFIVKIPKRIIQLFMSKRDLYNQIDYDNFFKEKKKLLILFTFLKLLSLMNFNLCCCRTWYNYFSKDLLKFLFWFILRIITFDLVVFSFHFWIFLEKKSGCGSITRFTTANVPFYVFAFQ